MSIDARDVSIVVQGAVSHEKIGPKGETVTATALASCRRHYPGAQIVLSTWQGSNVHGLEFDDLVLSVDPGNLAEQGDRGAFNLNRQIVSTQNGLKVATRKYAIKTRTDVEFIHGHAIRYLNRFKIRDSEYSFTKSRVIVSNFTSRMCASSGERGLFHVCDFFYFGLLEDVSDIFAIPLYQREWVNYTPVMDRLQGDRKGKNNNRFSPETYIWLSFVKQHLDIDYEDRLSISRKVRLVSEKTIANNLCILDRHRLGIDSLKYDMPWKNYSSMYSFMDWLKLYNRHSGAAAPIYRIGNLDKDLIISRFKRTLKLIRRAIGKLFREE